MIIGRHKEIKILEQVVASREAEFVALYGRRRVGKTYLVQQCLSKKEIYLECMGTKGGSLKKQLANFNKAFSQTFYPGLVLQAPNAWDQAFELLTLEMGKIARAKKIILFFDELPWLAVPKSRLIETIDYFWNAHWSKMPNLKLIVCGSAASWILNNLINAQGGLYNRITKIMLLEPFNLCETKEFLESRSIKISQKQTLDLYMIMGGIPYYLKQIERSKSIIQNINELCFKKDGLLYTEFERLFQSLFKQSQTNLQIVKEISKHPYGLSMSILLKKIKKTAGGTFNERLRELEACGFIQKILPHDRTKRDHLYKVIDEYTLFYLKWIDSLREGQLIPNNENYWQTIVRSPSWYSWSGIAFENVCIKHIHLIIKALGLHGMISRLSNWQFRAALGSKEEIGAQIDMLLERADGAITVCEMKYTTELFSIDKSYAKNLENKLECLQKAFAKDRQLFLAIVTVAGLKKNMWSEDLVHQTVILKDLFEK